MKIFLLSLIIVFLSFSCTKENLNGSSAENPELAKELRSQPETLQINNQNYILSTFIWRDFFPPSEANGSKLAAVTKLTETDSLAIPNSFSLERIYIIKGDEIYTSKYESTEQNPEYILSGTVTSGPKWETKSTVDVVCVFKDGNSNTTYKIQAKSQLINETH